MSDDICPVCGDPVVQPRTGRRRQFCQKCSPSDRRFERAKVLQLQQPEPEIDDSKGLTGATIAALDKAGVLNSWQGAACVALARLIDQGKHGSAGAAANVRGHREAMDFALRESGEDADVITMIFASED
jgi:hypothetical protein